MKLLIDSCVWAGDRNRLAAAGHEAIWAADWPADPGDDEILARAIADERVLITLDKDFGELTVPSRVRHFGIIRLVDLSTSQQLDVCMEILQQHANELAHGALITAQ